MLLTKQPDYVTMRLYPRGTPRESGQYMKKSGPDC
jgi:hypothetical protein